MLETRTTSPSIQHENEPPHLQLDLPGPPLSPPSSFPSLQDNSDVLSNSVKEKRRKQVPVSGRGGLGNIRARKRSNSNVASSSPTNPLRSKDPSTSTSSSFSPFRRTFTSSSSSTRSTLSSSASIRSTVGSVGATVGSGSSNYSVESRTRSGSISTSSPHSDDAFEIGSLLPSTSASPSESFTSKPGNGSDGTTAKHTSGTRTTSVASDYVLHLHADARQRALEKRLVRERAKEARMLAGSADGPAGLGLGEVTGEGEGPGSEGVEERVIKLRSGRGGAGVLKKVGGGIDPSLHPRAADIAREYEERTAAQEKSIVAASRLRSTLQGSTGRGGAGNVGVVGKSIEKKQSKKDDKGKGRAEIVDDGGENELSLEELAVRESRDNEDDATLVYDVKKDKKRGRGLRKFWKRVRSNMDSNNDVASNSSPDDGNTPRPSMGEGVLDIAGPSSPCPSAPSVSSQFPPYASASPPASSSSALGSVELRKQTRSKEELREGAALLAFVNAALPDLQAARNVLGVPGTPGFPLPGMKTSTSSSVPGQPVSSSRSSTPVTVQAAPIPSEHILDECNRVELPTRRPVRQVETVVEEDDWVDDETLQDADGIAKEEDEEEDSDIDPQLLPSAPKHLQDYSLPRKCHVDRPDSLDVVIRAALDKLDRSELKDRGDHLAEEREEGIIDAYLLTGSEDMSFNTDDRLRPSTTRRPIYASRGSSARPPPSSFVLPSTPRYLRATAPALPARFSAGARAVNVPGTVAEKRQTRVRGARPPPARPIPRLPENI